MELESLRAGVRRRFYWEPLICGGHSVYLSSLPFACVLAYYSGGVGRCVECFDARRDALIRLGAILEDAEVLDGVEGGRPSRKFWEPLICGRDSIYLSSLPFAEILAYGGILGRFAESFTSRRDALIRAAAILKDADVFWRAAAAAGKDGSAVVVYLVPMSLPRRVACPVRRPLSLAALTSAGFTVGAHVPAPADAPMFPEEWVRWCRAQGRDGRDYLLALAEDEDYKEFRDCQDAFYDQENRFSSPAPCLQHG